ncbi:MAG: Fe-Mn family superoxide dismutase [bacterium]|nr:Fe-Mn family superoxide dismutase [bacterium]
MYTEQTFDLKNIDGLSEKQIENHLKLYSGYVKNTNALEEKLGEYMSNAEQHATALSELKRRLGFEFDGMRLHEYYFEALGGEKETEAPILNEKITQQYDQFDHFLNEFKAVGMMRGIGWALLYHDPKAKRFHTAWISDHELGHLAGCDIILAMDVWEHAYLLDYLPSQRKDYIEVFFKNLNWSILEDRIKQSCA